MQNATDFLAVSAARLVPTNNKCSIELIFRPTISENITNLRVFDDDKKIIDFITNDETFKDSVIDDEEHQANPKIGNFMPKGVNMLEGLFDLNRTFRRPTNAKIDSSSMQYELINLGTVAKPKYVNLGKCCSLGERSKFISLFQQYKDIFAWTYEDLRPITPVLSNISFLLKRTLNHSSIN